MITSHTLHSDFQEFDSKISSLKTSNSHFRKLYEEYNSLDKEIFKMETSEVFTDKILEDLKKKRVALKDELFGILKEN